MLKKLSIAALIGVYSIIFAEIFVRLLSPYPLIPRFVTGGENGVRANIPGSVYRHVTPEVDVEFRINEQGIRADETIPQDKPEDIFRIVLLGDSFFMGYESTLEDSLAGRLPLLLAECGIKADVVNLAVSGFGSAESLVMLRTRGVAFDPDFVVMQWHRGDVTDNFRSGLFALEDGELKQTRQSYLPAVSVRDTLREVPGYDFMVQHSHLYTAVRDRLSIFVKNLLVQINLAFGPAAAEVPNTPDPSAAVPVEGPVLHESILFEARDVASRHGAEFAIFDVPIVFGDTLISSFGEIREPTLEQMHAFSPLDEFMAHLDEGIYLKEGHGHWTVQGNRIAAEVLARELAQAAGVGQCHAE